MGLKEIKEREPGPATWLPWVLYVFAIFITFYWASNGASLLQSYLCAVVVFNGGIQGLFSAFGHLIFPQEMVEKRGWRNSYFQTEVAGIYLAIGLASIISLVNIAWAVPVAFILGIFSLARVYAHFKSKIIKNPEREYNLGPILYITAWIGITLLAAVFWILMN